VGTIAAPFATALASYALHLEFPLEMAAAAAAVAVAVVVARMTTMIVRQRLPASAQRPALTPTVIGPALPPTRASSRTRPPLSWRPRLPVSAATGRLDPQP
jgi:hypothetical protein